MLVRVVTTHNEICCCSKFTQQVTSCCFLVSTQSQVASRNILQSKRKIITCSRSYSFVFFFVLSTSPSSERKSVWTKTPLICSNAHTWLDSIQFIQQSQQKRKLNENKRKCFLFRFDGSDERQMNGRMDEPTTEKIYTKIS